MLSPTNGVSILWRTTYNCYCSALCCFILWRSWFIGDIWHKRCHVLHFCRNSELLLLHQRKRWDVLYCLTKKGVFCHKQKKVKIKVIFCFFASKSAPPWSIFESSWTNGSRTLLKYKYWSSFFFSKGPGFDELLLPQLGYKRTGVRISANINLQPVFVLWI